MPEVQVSSLSPTYHQRSFDASMSPREMPRIIESDVPLQVRQGVALTSKKAGTIGANTKLRVLETRAWREDGTQRVLVGAVEANEGTHKSCCLWVGHPFWGRWQANLGTFHTAHTACGILLSRLLEP